MTTGQRAVESVQSFANRFAAGVGWKTSPSVLHDALQPWVEAIRAAARAPLEARIASLEGDIRFLLGQADRHNIAMCKAQDDKDAALARAQLADDVVVFARYLVGAIDNWNAGVWMTSYPECRTRLREINGHLDSLAASLKNYEATHRTPTRGTRLSARRGSSSNCLS